MNDRTTIQRPTPATRQELLTAIRELRHFIGRNQWQVMNDCAKGEEGAFFVGKFAELAKLTATMPRTYEQEGKGWQAIAHLHYFTAGADWYITERDTSPEQLQAFGLTDLFGDGGELGYIPVCELIACGAELDLHWSAKTLEECRKGD